MFKPTEKTGFFKGEGVIQNRDTKALENYKKRKEKDRRINTLEETVSDMQNDLKDIKTLLQRLVK